MKPLTAVGRAGRQLAQGVVQLIFPAVCGACGRSLDTEEGAFCSGCRATLTTDPLPTCPRCAASVGPHAVVEDGCSQCRGSHFHFDKANRLGPYQGLLRELVLRLKHSTGETLAELLGGLWAEGAQDRPAAAGAGGVSAVPLPWSPPLPHRRHHRSA